MERKEGWINARCVRIFWAVLVIVLCAAPCVRADETVPAGETWDIPGDELPNPIIGNLWVDGTTNLLTGASVSDSIYVQTGGTLNMYSGTIGTYSFISVSPDAIGLTVFGTDLAIDGSPVDYGELTLGGSGTLTGYYGDESEINLWILGNTINLQPPPGDVIEVTIDIKPGSDPNPINQGSNGVIPVAILTTDSFDASTVDPGTVTLAGAEVAVRGKSEKLMARLEDVDGDGDEDLMLQVDTQSWAELWEGGDVTLTGYTYEALGGEEIQGIDSVIIVPPQ